MNTSRLALLGTAAVALVAVGVFAATTFADGSGGLTALPPPGAGSAGADDLQFGSDDGIRLTVGDDVLAVHDAVPSPSGGLVVVGLAGLGDDRLGFMLMLDANGEPMSGFGNGGVETLGRWTPGRVAVTEEGGVVAVGGAVDSLQIWRGDLERRGETATTSVAAPVAEGDVAVGIPVRDVTITADGIVMVAGVILVNRAEDIGGCCAIEPDSIPFQLRLTADGAPDTTFGPGGFLIAPIEPGESVAVPTLPGSAHRERPGVSNPDPRTTDLGFTADVIVTIPGGPTVAVGMLHDRGDATAPGLFAAQLLR